MQSENPRLTPAQARHLTVHGANQNEDGTYSWKFDNYVRTDSAYGMTQGEIEQLWSRISCPTLLVYGKESWAWKSNPEQDGRLAHFQQARVAAFDAAGHWVHHDKLDEFLDLLRGFL
jgi:pimeloyl-ACP methyl ester carboxylesterase